MIFKERDSKIECQVGSTVKDLNLLFDHSVYSIIISVFFLTPSEAIFTKDSLRISQPCQYGLLFSDTIYQIDLGHYPQDYLNH